MADQHAKGAVSTAKGTVNEGVGKLTGDKKLEAKGKVQKVQGKAQDSLDDVQNALSRAGTTDPRESTRPSQSCTAPLHPGPVMSGAGRCGLGRQASRRPEVLVPAVRLSTRCAPHDQPS